MHATHVVVRARTDRDRRVDRIDAGEGHRQLADLRQALHDLVAAEVAQVQQHRAVDAAAFHDLGGLRAGHDVTRGELELVRRVLAHEPLAVLVEQDAALAAGTLGHQHAAGVQRRRVELHELHVLERHAGAERQAHAVTGGAVRVRGGRVHAAGAAGREHDRLGADRLDGAVHHVVGDDPGAAAMVIGDQLGDEVLLVARDVVLDAHRVQRVEDHQAGQVGGVTGAREAGAAERTLGDLARRLVTGEDRTPVLELDDLARRVAAENLDRVLVAQVVRALDRVEGVVLGRVVGRVAERGVDAALGRPGVTPHRVDLRH